MCHTWRSERSEHWNHAFSLEGHQMVVQRQEHHKALLEDRLLSMEECICVWTSPNVLLICLKCIIMLYNSLQGIHWNVLVTSKVWNVLESFQLSLCVSEFYKILTSTLSIIWWKVKTDFKIEQAEWANKEWTAFPWCLTLNEVVRSSSVWTCQVS